MVTCLGITHERVNGHPYRLWTRHSVSHAPLTGEGSNKEKHNKISITSSASFLSCLPRLPSLLNPSLGSGQWRPVPGMLLALRQVYSKGDVVHVGKG